MTTPSEKSDIQDALTWCLEYGGSPSIFFGMGLAEGTTASPPETAITTLAVESQLLEEFSKVYPHNGNKRDGKIESMMRNALYFEKDRVEGLDKLIAGKKERLASRIAVREEMLEKLARGGPNVLRHSRTQTMSPLIYQLKSVQRRIRQYRRNIESLQLERDNPPITRGPAAQ